jgi:aminopeptidase N
MENASIRTCVLTNIALNYRINFTPPLFKKRARFAMKTFIALLLMTSVAWAAPQQSQVNNNTTLIRHFEALGHGRMHTLDADSVHSYDQIALSLDYRVEEAQVPIAGVADITLVGRAPILEIPLNAEGLTIDSVFLEGQAVSYRLVNDTLYLQHSLQAGDTLTFSISVTATINGNSNDVGYHIASNHVYTFAEPWGARRWYPCFDEPYDKFNEVTVAINMPDYWELASNGLLIETTNPEAGRKREVYHHDHPIAPYLVMMAAGRYARWFENVNGVSYRYFALRQDSTHARYDWQRTSDMVRVFSDMFGPYPFEEYGMVDANIMGGWGAMEHQTLTTYGNHLINGSRAYEDVVAHELSHMWFGDHLTCVDFRNIWLNEGFATYCAELYYEIAENEQAFQQMLTQSASYYFNEDQTIRYPIYNPPEAYIFGSAEYDKGGWVLHMLRKQIMGDSLFFQAMRTYRTRFGGGNVSTQDFVGVVNETMGQNLQWFFDQWIYQAGYPEIGIGIHPQIPGQNQLSVSISQEQTNAPLFRFPLLMDVTLSNNHHVMRQFWFSQRQEIVSDTFSLPVLSAVLAVNQPLLYAQTGAVSEPEIPTTFKIGEIYPNPFNSVTRIPLELSTQMRVKIDVFDLNGRRVQTLADGVLSAGKHDVSFSARNGMSSGVYFISIHAGNMNRIAKAVYLR